MHTTTTTQNTIQHKPTKQTITHTQHTSHKQIISQHGQQYI